MALKRNRFAQAWWVVALTLVSNLALSLVRATIATPGVDFFLQHASAGVFGVAAVWLLSPYFNRQVRFLAFLGTLLALEVSGVLAGVVRQEWSTDDERMRLLASVAVFGLVLSLAVHLAGWSCRGRVSPLRLSCWVLLWLVACWAVAFLALSFSFGHGSLREMALALLITTAVTFGVLLPFLLLSFTNGFFDARLKEVLRLE
jgi:hypothetical protein